MFCQFLCSEILRWNALQAKHGDLESVRMSATYLFNSWEQYAWCTYSQIYGKYSGFSNQHSLTKKILKTKLYVSDRTSKIYHYAVVTQKSSTLESRLDWSMWARHRCCNHKMYFIPAKIMNIGNTLTNLFKVSSDQLILHEWHRHCCEEHFWTTTQGRRVYFSSFQKL